MFNDKSIFVSGGTGSFGQMFVKIVLERFKPKRVVVFSRDELKQYEMSQRFPASRFPVLRYFIGDVRDQPRLRRALEGIDMVVHAAALKHVPIAEYNPFECIKTNILGAQNLIEACLDSGVRRVVALSTDKAAAPINLYGATKLASDKLFIAANNIRGSRDLRFSVVRYGNVMGSRGSVIPMFLRQRTSGRLSITHPDMTRFNITLEAGVDLVLKALNEARGGEVLVPKLPSYRITDLATAIAPDCAHDIIGMRPGEKLHEEMITASDSFRTVDLGDCYAILPGTDNPAISDHYLRNGARPVSEGFCYNSGSNAHFLSVDTLREMIESQFGPAALH